MEIEGFPNYLIYPDGRVWSKTSGRYLKQINDTYIRIGLTKDKKRYQKQLHRLLAEHFIPNPNNKSCVDHINQDRHDNRLENLRWATTSENGQNVKSYNTNTSGHKGISKNRNRWNYCKCINGKNVFNKSLKTKKEALCYKYGCLLMIACKIR